MGIQAVSGCHPILLPADGERPGEVTGPGRRPAAQAAARRGRAEDSSESREDEPMVTGHWSQSPAQLTATTAAPGVEGAQAPVLLSDPEVDQKLPNVPRTLVLSLYPRTLVVLSLYPRTPVVLSLYPRTPVLSLGEQSSIPLPPPTSGCSDRSCSFGDRAQNIPFPAACQSAEHFG